MLSIDQNCNSLWDVLPKVQALHRQGHAVRQLVEDIDVAFTSLGSAVDSEHLRLARERYHRSGGADWGAALFYSQFLGRQAVDIRCLEPYTGMKTDVLARQLERSVDSLFDEFSAGDNWQLIGASYVADRQHHRVVGDLGVAQVAPHLRQLLRLARQDMETSFPDAAARQRLAEWFGREEHRVEQMIGEMAGGRLVDLYDRWLRFHVDGQIGLGRTSDFFALRPEVGRTALLEIFLRDYDLAAGLYNQAVHGTELRALKTEQGELPFFAAMDFAGHQVRTAVFLRAGKLVIGDREIPLPPDRRLPIEELNSAGICCMVGKAILLVIQVRQDPDGRPLALPHKGSVYMPISHRLVRLLDENKLLPGSLRPLYRVRLRLLDRLRELDTTIHLPEYLRPHFGAAEIPARRLGEAWQDLAAQAAARLENIKDPAQRAAWQRETFPKLVGEIDAMDQARRMLAAACDKPDPPTIRGIWEDLKTLRTKLLDATFRQVFADYQTSQLEYWDSRGAVMPWCIALGGESFYDQLLARAEITIE